ncbi:MAG: hypothetical protein RL026_2266 [Pseudomonadota bacterium]|jgi:Tfp pilus assembly protein PilX
MQRGLALPVSLLFAALIALLVLAGQHGSLQQWRLASIYQGRLAAWIAAESALNAAWAVWAATPERPPTTRRWQVAEGSLAAEAEVFARAGDRIALPAGYSLDQVLAWHYEMHSTARHAQGARSAVVRGFEWLRPAGAWP